MISEGGTKREDGVTAEEDDVNAEAVETQRQRRVHATGGAVVEWASRPEKNAPTNGAMAALEGYAAWGAGEKNKNKLEESRRSRTFPGAGAEGAEMAEERSYGRRSDIPAWLLVPTGVSAAGLAGIHLRSASKRNFNLTGLGRGSALPAARHCSRQPASTSAVMATIGTCRFEPSLDRKSTRLNSSHLGISYAVFCL